MRIIKCQTNRENKRVGPKATSRESDASRSSIPAIETADDAGGNGAFAQRLPVERRTHAIAIRIKGHMLRSNFLLTSAATTLAEPILGAPAHAAGAVGDTSSAIHVTIPVVLERADVAFNMEHLAFAGDMPVGISHIGMMLDRFEGTSTPHVMIAIFHGPAGYMMLNDASYDGVRKTLTGNPYKEPLARLVGRGVKLEMCAMSMKAMGWTNPQLLPNVGVNTGAEIRLVQLNQMGYTILHP